MRMHLNAIALAIMVFATINLIGFELWKLSQYQLDGALLFLLFAASVAAAEAARREVVKRWPHERG